MEERTTKRLFFGYGIEACWPEKLPEGRVLAEGDRHLTTLFLGGTDWKQLEPLLESTPSMPWKLGPIGVFDRAIFLPPKHPRVAAWSVSWLKEKALVEQHVNAQQEFFHHHLNVQSEHHSWLPHCTLSRSPRSIEEWKKAFAPRVMRVSGFYLYESVGQLQYRKIWGEPCLKAFERVKDGANVVFLVRGRTFPELHHHAEAALAFEFPEMIPFLQQEEAAKDLDSLVDALHAFIENGECRICFFDYEEIKKIKGDIFEWKVIAGPRE